MHAKDFTSLKVGYLAVIGETFHQICENISPDTYRNMHFLIRSTMQFKHALNFTLGFYIQDFCISIIALKYLTIILEH